MSFPDLTELIGYAAFVTPCHPCHVVSRPCCDLVTTLLRPCHTLSSLTVLAPSHYAKATFMNDGNGYPMALKLPDDTAWLDAAAAAAPSSSGPTRIPDWRQSKVRLS